MDTFTFLAIILLLAQGATADVGRTNRSANDQVMRGGIIGAIVDNSSRFGKEQKVAMDMAIMDVKKKTGQSCGLNMTTSQTVVAAWDLINQQKVKAILLPHTWEEASLVAEIGNQAKIPVLSIADSTPLWATKRWPFLLQASPDQNAQMKAIAAIVDSWEWHQVTIIYEDIDSFRSGVIPYLSDAMREIGAEISNLVALSPFDSSSLSTELERLKGEQCRVFLVHLSLPLAMQFFVKAKEMNMMEKDYVWITTNPFTSLVHSLNASIISSMRGIIGVKSYYPQKDNHFQNFHTRFRKRFSFENPEEDNHDPGTLAMQTYDVVWTVCLAMRERSNGGQQLLHKIMLSKFNNVQFFDRKVARAQIFQIINVIGFIGKSYNELGFWSYGKGFSKTTDDRALYNTSMRHLRPVFWPGGPWTSTPRGWTSPSTAKPLRIAVPTQSPFKQYVNVEHDPLTNITNYTGFAIDLFRETVARLSFNLTYNFTPFDGNYDEMVEQVYLKKFDAVVGDVAIVAKRYQHAEFTHPYTESGLVMIVPVRTKNSNRAWLFVKPFTKAMWVLVGAISVYNSFVVWLIERKHHPELKASFFIQMGVVLCSAFTTLFSLQGKMKFSFSYFH
ncbi:hypothetical protein FH972_019611 [Carpinus fangiana]|uniref:Ionotropic glutamate receptor C-terminal domain-containing protein n=1 Tax=Carpinus fangiana TaxID=176857 RepID=A0A5N6RQZ5_9ROSI|nr:hypothetical protein FH972_019611 [Carpinus fangiana]